MDPYRIDAPAMICVSGGRTSGFMLRRVIDAHGGSLPPDVIPIFCNTGLEHERTYEFLQDLGERWAPITWLEYRRTDDGHDFVRVTFGNASRKGEPFEQLIGAKRMLPNPVMRFCTAELKIRTGNRFAKSLGWEHWDRAVGLRADEPRRVAKMKGDIKAENVLLPMADAGHTLQDVRAFWAEQDFDLQLPGGDDAFGNCVGCFLKGRYKLEKVAMMEPGSLDWWIEREAEPPPGTESSAVFRQDRPPYRVLAELGRQPRLFNDSYSDEQDESIPCMCTD